MALGFICLIVTLKFTGRALLLMGSKLLLVVVLAFNFVSCEKKAPWFDRGTSKEQVYKILGKPSNSDPELVAVWLEKPTANAGDQSWRVLLANQRGRVKWIAVFDDKGRSLMGLVCPAQTSIAADMDDDTVRDMAKHF
ncbi:hypothetical protein [Chthoniobacter flavus]|uniref:hypothetical protein n=1 Tax=Chthoniobacter flavus TaxID=191863 RepID=UPI001049CFDF|nr:hypothetical protein [Chthoniobacter flavus]